MGTFNDLLIEIGIDTTKAKKELNKLDKLFDSVGKSFKESISQGNKNTKLLPFDSKQFKSETQVIINQLKKAGQEVKQFQSKLNATKSPAKLKTLRKDLELQLKGLTKFEDATNQERIKDHHLAEKKKLAAYNKSKKAEQATSTNTHKVRMSEEERLQARQEKRINTIRRLESRLENSVNFRALKPDQQAEFKERFKEQSKRFLKGGDTTELSNGFRTLSTDIKEFKRQMIGLQTVQSGVADSTRNMIRSYASLFAMIEGTQAIERVGMDFQGMEVSMLASAESSKKAAKDLQYVNGIADEMGVNLKDATDAYVKLQFAAKGKMDDAQIKELFTNVNRFATSLKITPEQLKNSQKALQQMLNKGTLMAEEVFFASFR